jgi:hypothetical protein
VHHLRTAAALLAIALLACQGQGRGAAIPDSSSTPGMPRPVALATGIGFLPDTLSTAEQLRASLVLADGALFFADTSEHPVKRLDLASGSVTPIANRVGRPDRLALLQNNVLWYPAATAAA